MHDPFAEAGLRLLRVQEEGFREVLAGLPDGALNWRPGPDTNSIAVLVEHAWGSAQMWTARAAGQEIERDRAAEFRANRDAAELQEVLARGLARVEELLAAADPTRYDEADEPAARPGQARTEPITRAWCLLHAVEHVSEHLGQAQLTRQLWQQRQA